MEKNILELENVFKIHNIQSNERILTALSS